MYNISTCHTVQGIRRELLYGALRKSIDVWHLSTARAIPKFSGWISLSQYFDVIPISLRSAAWNRTRYLHHTHHLPVAGNWHRRNRAICGWSCPGRHVWRGWHLPDWTSHTAWLRSRPDADPPRTERPWGNWEHWGSFCVRCQCTDSEDVTCFDALARELD